jgi:hypothetical protein
VDGINIGISDLGLGRGRERGEEEAVGE